MRKEVIAALVVAFLLLPAAGRAADVAPVTCANADALMSAHAVAAPAPSGNVDRDFAAQMMAHDQAVMAMAKMEAACGKDPRERAAALQMAEAAKRQIDDVIGTFHFSL